MRGDPAFPGDLDTLAAAGPDALARAGDTLLKNGAPLDRAAIRLKPLLRRPSKIVCIGLNYVDHSAESGFETPNYPTVFGRFPSSLIGADDPIVRPHVSEQLDYEGELVAVIGKRGHAIAESEALGHVLGYTVFNDASIRDYQFKSPQWTVGKNFDGTGALGPELVTPDELPLGAAGLKLETRLNGKVVQSANTDDMVFGVARLIAILSEAFTLEPGDVIVTGTPAGVGLARKPALWMKPGDVCEVEIERVGLLSNRIVQQDAAAATDRKIAKEPA